MVYDLESKSYGTTETAKKAKGYAEFLKTPNFLFYLHFFHDISKDPSKQDLEIFVDIMSGSTEDAEGMAVLFKIMMTISASTAACERGFLCMNDEKTSLRTHLFNDTLNNILRINVNGPLIEEFTPFPHVQSWIDSTKGTHHIKGHAKPMKRKQKKNDSDTNKKVLTID